MGLDQKLYIAKEELTEDYYIRLGEKITDEDGVCYYDESTVLDNILYLRKVNWIHGYMDKLCKSKTGHEVGNTDYFVFNQKDLNKLINICREVVKTKSVTIAEELLPPTRGCFFGCYEINEDYFESVQDFINVMCEYEEDDNQYVYWSWW
jgi:hypothetical protein